MKYSMLLSALFGAVALSACDKPTVITPPAPAPAPAPSTVAVPVPVPVTPPAASEPK